MGKKDNIIKGYFRDKNRFADYPLHLLCINEERDFSKFHTEIRQLFHAMQYRGDKKGLLQMVENEEEYSHLDLETLEAVSVLLDIPQIWENREKYMKENEKETGDMCQAIRELMEDARNEGIKQGVEQGLEQGIKQGVKQSLKAFIEFAQEMNLSKEDTIQKIREKYELGEEKVASYVERYWE